MRLYCTHSPNHLNRNLQFQESQSTLLTLLSHTTAASNQPVRVMVVKIAMSVMSFDHGGVIHTGRAA